MKINPSLTIEKLYTKYSQEYIMHYYLSKIAGKPVNLSSKMYNPMRIDNHASAGVYYKTTNRGMTLFFRDFTGYFSGDCISVAGYYYGHKTGMFDLLLKINNELKDKEQKEIQLVKSKAKSWKIDTVSEHTYNISFKIRKENGKVKWLEADKKYWGNVFTPDFLIQSNVFPVEKVWIEYDGVMQLKYISNENYPVYVYLFDSGDVIKVLAPNHGKKHKWRNNGNSTVIEGYDLLKPDTTKIWCTSYKDSLCFNAHTDMQGYNYLGEYVIPDKLLPNTKYVFIDNDMPGKRIGVKIRKRFPELKILCIPKNMGCKDPFEFTSKYGIEYSVKCLNRIISEEKRNSY